MWGQHICEWFMVNRCRLACRTRYPGFESRCSQPQHFGTNKPLVSQASCRALCPKALPNTGIPSLTLRVSPGPCVSLPAPASLPKWNQRRDV